MYCKRKKVMYFAEHTSRFEVKPCMWVWRFKLWLWQYPSRSVWNYFYSWIPQFIVSLFLSPSLHHHSNAHNNDYYHINPLRPSRHAPFPLPLWCMWRLLLSTPLSSFPPSFIPYSSHILSSSSISVPPSSCSFTALPIILCLCFFNLHFKRQLAEGLLMALG